MNVYSYHTCTTFVLSFKDISCTMQLGKNDGARLQFSISGHKFIVSQSTLLKYPETKLGQLAVEMNEDNSSQPELYFDADEEVFREILRFYRSGEIHVPTTMCYQSFVRQLKFWEISTDFIGHCCRPEKDEQAMEEEFLWFEKRIEPDTSTVELSLRWNIWYFLTDPLGPHTRFGKLSCCWAILYQILTLSQAFLYAAMTSSAVNKQFIGDISYQEVVRESIEQENYSMTHERVNMMFKMPSAVVNIGFMVFFFVEIITRFISCPEKKFFLNSLNMMDLVISVSEVGSFLLMVSLGLSVNVNDDVCHFIAMSSYVMHLLTNLRVSRILRIAALRR